MTNQITADIVTGMFNYLNSEQLNQLKLVVAQVLDKYEVIEKQTALATYDDSNTALVMRFLAWKSTEGKSPNTLKQYKFTLEKMLRAVRKPIQEISETDIFLYLSQLKVQGSSSVYLNNIRLNLSSFFNWLYDKEFIKTNPMKGINPIKTKKEIKHVFTDVDMEKMKKNTKTPRDTAIIEFLYSTGVRASELCSVNISDVDFINKSVKVCGKGNKERVVYLNTTCVYYLKEYLKTRTDLEEALFVKEQRGSGRLKVAGVEEMLRKLGAACDIEKLHPHKFRRTLATNLLKKGMSIEEVSKILGHAKLDTTMIYCNVDNEITKNEYMRIMG